ncbi:hypothetical protein CBM2599_A70081 [Cupriavidus taiwanensis]|nr:hypothetical protein CBM2599_A70081 [Cupriavidus taiwanensis]SOY91542.1 hypothetical protein CBM2600_A80081 [Cupriavidus taiwanensis]SPA24223.1 hypothetical protein CBM2637_A120183 [Cupriavidus taiwanensis]SPA49271.1 protein of unknown function [Cupriavidus taiwanensis]
MVPGGLPDFPWIATTAAGLTGGRFFACAGRHLASFASVSVRRGCGGTGGPPAALRLSPARVCWKGQ